MVQEVIERDKNPKKDSQSDRYSTAQKQKAVVLYRMLGSFALIESMTGIHHETLRKWKQTEWWKEYEADILAQGKAELTGNLKKIVTKAFVQLEDRLENGDFIFDQKTGEMRRKPVGAHTVNQILQTGLDKQFLIDKLQRDQKIAETQDSIEQRLQRLGEEFQRFANAKEISADVSAYKDVTNAVHDQAHTQEVGSDAGNQPQSLLEAGGFPQPVQSLGQYHGTEASTQSPQVPDQSNEGKAGKTLG